MLTRSKGFTQLELLIALGILAILAALSIPSLRSAFERNDLVAAAEALSADLRWVHGEALKRGVDLKVTFTSGGAYAWRYQVTTQTTTPETLKVVDSSHSAQFGEVALTDVRFPFGHLYTVFDHARGTAEGHAGRIELTSAQSSYRLKVEISSLGRVEICSIVSSPDGAVFSDMGKYLQC